MNFMKLLMFEDPSHNCCCRLGLDVVQIPGNIRQALSELKTCRPELKAVCMGTRRTDPHSGGCCNSCKSC